MSLGWKFQSEMIDKWTEEERNKGANEVLRSSSLPQLSNLLLVVQMLDSLLALKRFIALFISSPDKHKVV